MHKNFYGYEKGNVETRYEIEFIDDPKTWERFLKSQKRVSSGCRTCLEYAKPDGHAADYEGTADPENNRNDTAQYFFKKYCYQKNKIESE